MRVQKIDVAPYCHEDLFLEVHQIKAFENILRDICDAHVLSPVKSFRAYGFHQAIEETFVTTTTMATGSKPCEGALSSIPNVLDEAASVIFLN